MHSSTATVTVQNMPSPLFLFFLLIPLVASSSCPSSFLIHKFQLGRLNGTILSDGPGIFDVNFFLVPDAAIARALAASFRDPLPLVLQQNALIIDTPSSRILVDAGSLNLPEFPFFSKAGKLVQNMKAAGISPNSIDAVLITHGHGDHVAGIRTLEGKQAFPNAKIYVSEDEHRFWSTEQIVNPRPDGPDDAFWETLGDIYKRSIRPYADQLVLVPPGSSPFPGVRFVPSPGHSPGHTAIRFSSRQKHLLVTGDSFVTSIDQLKNPAWGFFVESNLSQAYDTRIKLLSGAARRKDLVLSYHEQFPGLGYVSENGDAFRWTVA